MSLPKSHELRQRLPALVQQMDQRQQLWLKIRQKINDLCTNELPDVMRGNTGRFDLLREAMDRLYEVRESTPIFTPDYKLLPALQRSVLLVASDTHLVAVQEAGNDAAASNVNWCVDIPLLPPGVDNIRSSLRRPGAPFAALPH